MASGYGRRAFEHHPEELTKHVVVHLSSSLDGQEAKDTNPLTVNMGNRTRNHTVATLQVYALHIPHHFPNLNDNRDNRVLRLRHTDNSVAIFTFPVGNYDTADLAGALAPYSTAAGGFLGAFTLAFDDKTGKASLTNDSAEEFTVEVTPLSKLLGFGDSEVTSSSAAVAGSHFVDLIYPKFIRIESPSLTHRSNYNINERYREIIHVQPVDVPFLGTIGVKPQDPIIVPVAKTLDHVTFEIYGDDGILIPFTSDWSIDLAMHLVP